MIIRKGDDFFNEELYDFQIRIGPANQRGV
jgi:hypothetical protein